MAEGPTVEHPTAAVAGKSRGLAFVVERVATVGDELVAFFQCRDPIMEFLKSLIITSREYVEATCAVKESRERDKKNKEEARKAREESRKRKAVER
jgi:hypothetical protein